MVNTFLADCRLSADDDKDWQGDKRRGLEQGLFHVLSERARELADKHNWQLNRLQLNYVSTAH